MARKKVIELKPGLKLRGWDRTLWHVVGTLPDGDVELWVMKSWAKYKNYWVYEVHDRWSMDYLIEHQAELNEVKIRL